MKIYCLLIDAFPTNHNLKEFARNNGFSYSTQIANCFTTTTLYNMFTGFNSTDLVPGGVGYHSISNPEMKDLRWINDENIHLLDITRNNGWKWVSAGRIPFFLRDVVAAPLFDESFQCDSTRQGHLQTYYNFSPYRSVLDNNPRFSHLECLSLNPDGSKDFFWEGLSDDELRQEYLKIQKDQIEKIQNKKEDGFYFFQNVLWSHHKWGNQPKSEKQTKIEILDWLKFWDFEEEDACFWIFSDHGDDADDYMSPKSYLSWVMTKDNTQLARNKEVKPILSSMDFYKFSREKITTQKNIETPYSENIYEDINQSRVYFLEDARMHTDINKMVAGSAVTLLPSSSSFMDLNGSPVNNLLQVVHHNVSRKTYVYQCQFSETNNLKVEAYHYEQLSHLREIKTLRDILFNRFDWLL